MINALSYLGIASPAYAEWAMFGEQVLGLERVHDGPDGAIRFRMDEAECRLSVHPSDKNDIAYVGWSVSGPRAAAALAAHISEAGVTVSEATREEAESRRVSGYYWFLDLAGFRHELSWGQWVSPMTFRPGRPMDGFSTGEQGMGHIVLLVPDLEAADRFYREVMGFHSSDRIVIDGTIELLFYHVNGRHHSLAIGTLGGRTGAHHMMLEVRSLDDVGAAHDLCEAHGIPITSTIGRHTNDRMISFYLHTPSGLRIEYGYGGLEVDDLWVPKAYSRSSLWGHRKQHTELPPAMVIDRD
nr:2,3-dihydroxybiphenyl-1,2-dioxygenase [uncultured bacterium]